MNPATPVSGVSQAPNAPARKSPVVLIVALCVFAVCVGFVAWRILRPSPIEETDDARVMVHYTTIAPRVTAPITEVHVKDNQEVHKGELLVTLDEKDFLTAVQNAQSALERDRAHIADVSAAISRQPALITQAEAGVDAAKARLSLAQQNQTRYDNLAKSGAGTLQNHQQADSVLQQSKAELLGAQANLLAAQQQLAVLAAGRSSAEAQVRADQAQLEQAQLNLSYTRIVAPIDGTVGQLSAEIGNYTNAGTALMTLVPLHAVYIEANYREIQLRHVLPGQNVRIHLDAFNVDLHGRVDSIAPASGATFSAIPPENATGNFTKIVQRLPVKILVDSSDPHARLLRVGMNVETAIATNFADPMQYSSADSVQQKGEAR